jgi:hypothetical protein
MILSRLLGSLQSILIRHDIVVGLNVTPKGPSPLVGESELSRESEFILRRWVWKLAENRENL